MRWLVGANIFGMWKIPALDKLACWACFRHDNGDNNGQGVFHFGADSAVYGLEDHRFRINKI